MAAPKNGLPKPVSKSIDYQGYVAYFAEPTPAEAQAALASSGGNRRLKDRALINMERDTVEKDWDYCGDTVVYDEKHRLIDGHHRMCNIIRTGVPMLTLIVTGVQSMHNIDSGSRRSIADQLHLAGYSDCLAMASVLSLLWHHRNGTTQVGYHKYSPSNSELLELADKLGGPDGDLSDSIRKSAPLRCKAPYSNIAFLHFLTRTDDADVSFDDFIMDLAQGTNLGARHPAYVLRELLARDRTAKRRLSPVNRLACVIKAWNAYREGSEIASLRYNPYGRTKEKFPLVAGARPVSDLKV